MEQSNDRKPLDHGLVASHVDTLQLHAGALKGHLEDAKAQGKAPDPSYVSPHVDAIHASSSALTEHIAESSGTPVKVLTMPVASNVVHMPQQLATPIKASDFRQVSEPKPAAPVAPHAPVPVQIASQAAGSHASDVTKQVIAGVIVAAIVAAGLYFGGVFR